MDCSSNVMCIVLFSLSNKYFQSVNFMRVCLALDPGGSGSWHCHWFSSGEELAVQGVSELGARVEGEVTPQNWNPGFTCPSHALLVRTSQDVTNNVLILSHWSN